MSSITGSGSGGIGGAGASSVGGVPVLASQARGGPGMIAPAMPQGGAMPGAGATIDPLKVFLKYKWVLLLATLLGAGLGVAAHFALMRFYPRYTSRALFSATAPVRSIETMGAGEFNEVEMNRFLQTQARVMTGPSVLQSVAEDPNLPRNAPKWSARFVELDTQSGREVFNSIKAAKELEDDVVARPINNTTLIELSMTHTSPIDATAIVGLVKQKYLRRLEEQTRVRVEGQFDALTRSIDELTTNVNSLTTRRNNLIANRNLDSLNEQASTVRAEKIRLDDEYINVRQDLEARRKQLSQMEEERNNPAGSVYGDDLRSDVERDPIVIDIKQQLAAIDTEIQAMRNRGIGTAHPTFKIIEARQRSALARLEEERNLQLRKQFDGVIDSVRKAVQQLEGQEAELIARREETRLRSIELTQAIREVGDLDDNIKSLTEQRQTLQNALLSQQAIGKTEGAQRVVLEEDERVPTVVSFPKLKIMVPLGAILGLGLLTALIVVRELIDQRIKGPSDVALIPRTRLLGWVPDNAEDPAGGGNAETSVRDRPKGIVAESVRQLRAAIVRRSLASDHRVVLFVGSLPGSGTTTIALNTALALASTDKRVLLIDANFRRPALHKALGLPDAPGLADALTGVDLDGLVQATNAANLDLLSAGSKNLRVFERLGAAAMSDVLAKARATYDIVLVDTAPAVVAGDAVALAQRCDASVLVVRALVDKRGMVARVKNELQDSKAEFLGVVVNAVRSAAGGYLKGNIKVASQYQND